MPETKHWSYDLLKSLVVEKATSIVDVEIAKNMVKDDIKSNRRFACIRTMEQLLDCLERRDIISEFKVDTLFKLVINQDSEVSEAFLNYERKPEPDLLNVYELERIQEANQIKSHVKANPKIETNVIQFTEMKRNEVYKLIAQDIGRDWRSLGRELLVRAGELDKIDIKHPNNLHAKVYEVFNSFENDSRHNPRQHYNTICEALDNCKRKDIRRQVQNIMSY